MQNNVPPRSLSLGEKRELEKAQTAYQQRLKTAKARGIHPSRYNRLRTDSVVGRRGY